MVMGDRIKVVAQQAIRTAKQGTGAVPGDDKATADLRANHAAVPTQQSGPQAEAAREVLDD